MTELHIFKYQSDIVPDFRVFATNKHGTRFLREVNPIEKTHLSISQTMSEFERKLTETLFDFVDNPKSTSVIKLKKIQVLKKQDCYFVYRNPYDAFVSAIQTGYASSQVVKSSPNLAANMTNNGHFYTHYYRVLERILENVENDGISFIDLSDLTEFFRVQTLRPIQFSKQKYSFDSYITKEELEVLCKTHHPMLWHRFMIEIEKEKIALDNLIKKFDWKIKINKEMQDIQKNINP
jgi:hypothetical protein